MQERALVPIVQFRLEVDGGVARDDLADRVLRALERTYPEAWLAYRQRLIDVEFAFTPLGTLRRQRKLLRLVDERGAPVPDGSGPALIAGRR
jgi:hypothetical protein